MMAVVFVSVDSVLWDQLSLNSLQVQIKQSDGLRLDRLIMEANVFGFQLRKCVISSITDLLGS